MVVTKARLLRTIDQARVREAIRDAEKRSSGQIRVSISPLFWGDVYSAAGKAFDRMGMHATPERNAVLIFVVPARRKLVVWGDQGIHEKAGHEVWRQTVRIVAENFRNDDFTDGLVRAIAGVGDHLALHFPASQQRNELPDDID